MPHISVVIPTYNLAHLVGRSIESLLGQQFQDWDLLVVDDASSDETVDVVRGYCQRDGRIRLAVNERNLGLTRNWNRCLEMASGPLVEILQSDDLIDADYLERVSQFYKEHPSVGFVAASCRYIGPDDHMIHPGHPKPARLYKAGDEAVTALLTGGWPHVSSIVVRRECYEKLGTFDERIWHGPDGEMFTRLATQYDFYHFGDVCTSFRRHGSNMGVLNYLRDDYLSTDIYKKSACWGYLSPEGRRRLGVEDLDRHVARLGAATALTGAAAMLAYGRADLTRHYLRQAVRLDRRSLCAVKLWQVGLLSLLPFAGQWVMRSRLEVREVDQKLATKVRDSLQDLRNRTR